jgi:hypothetical protein
MHLELTFDGDKENVAWTDAMLEGYNKPTNGLSLLETLGDYFNDHQVTAVACTLDTAHGMHVVDDEDHDEDEYEDEEPE